MKRWPLLAALALSACAPALPATEIVLAVESDLPGKLQGAQVVLEPAADRAGPALFASDCVCVGTQQGCTALPLTLGLGPEAGDSNAFTVVARGYSDSGCTDKIVEQSATVTFATDQRLLLELDLTTACENDFCPSGSTCRDASGQCVDDARPSLPPFDIDAGVPLSPDSPDLGASD